MKNKERDVASEEQSKLLKLQEQNDLYQKFLADMRHYISRNVITLSSSLDDAFSRIREVLGLLSSSHATNYIKWSSLKEPTAAVKRQARAQAIKELAHQVDGNNYFSSAVGTPESFLIKEGNKLIKQEIKEFEKEIKEGLGPYELKSAEELYKKARLNYINALVNAVTSADEKLRRSAENLLDPND